jgi:hypothetical protein
VRQQRAIEAFRKRQHRGVYRAVQLTPGCKVIMRKPRRQGPLDLGWEGPYFFVGFMNKDQPLRDAKTIKSGKKTKAERKAAKEKKKQRRSERGETDGVEV